MTFAPGDPVTSDELNAIASYGTIIARGSRSTNSSSTSGTTELAVLRVDNITVKAGRLYLIYTGTVGVDVSVANDGARLLIRYDNTGANATTSSTLLTYSQMILSNIGVQESMQTMGTYAPGSDQTLSVLLALGRATGTGVLFVDCQSTATRPCELLVADMGPDPGDTGVDL